MGQKTNPVGFRLGVSKQHRSNWYAAAKGAGKTATKSASKTATKTATKRAARKTGGGESAES